MKKLGLVLGLLAAPAAANAGVETSVDILSPQAGTCMNNGGIPFDGATLVGQALPDPTDVEIVLRLRDDLGRDLEVTVLADDEPLYTVQHIFDEGETQTDVSYLINGFIIADGNDRTIIVTVTPSEGGATGMDSVTFDLDREPPQIVVDPEIITEIEGCFPQAPAIDFGVRDNRTAEGAITITNVLNPEGPSACSDLRRITLRDTCGTNGDGSTGNASIIDVRTQKTPAQGTIDVTLRGYRCTLQSCPTDGPDAQAFADGANVGRAALTYELDAPPDCALDIDANLVKDGDDANPAVLIQGDAIADAGSYAASVQVSACDTPVAQDTLDFVVLERPLADPGGPYDVAQGAPLQLDARGSFAAAELGGVVEIAWDLNRDGFFDPGEVGEDINGNGVLDEFEDLDGDGVLRPDRDLDGSGSIEPREVFRIGAGGIPLVDYPTDENGFFRVPLRITAGNGGRAFAEAQVTIGDVNPTCVLGGPYMGLEGEPIEFDASGSAPGDPTDPIVAWTWDFQDDGVVDQRAQSLPMPTHIYRESGSYTVRLRVEDGDSSADCTAQVTVTDPSPIVEGIAALDAENLVEGREVGFTAGTTRPGNASDPIVVYSWTVGVPGVPALRSDSTAGDPPLRAPRYTYADDGEYEVCLSVFDEDGDEANGCFMITVADLQPEPFFTGPALVSEGQEVMFDASNTLAGGAADPLTALRWEFNDGSDPVEVPPDQLTIRHTFETSADQLTVRLVAIDEDSEVAFERNIRVNDVVPTARVRLLYENEERVGYEGVTLTLDGSQSTPGSPTDPIASYRWDFGNGDTAESDQPTIDYAWGDQGTFVVTLTVVDEDGSEVGVTTTVRVDNVPPTVRIVDENGDDVDVQVEIGAEVAFEAIGDDVEADLPLSYTWNFGEGPDPEQAGALASHTFTALGPQTVRVRVSDGDGTCAPVPCSAENPCAGGGVCVQGLCPPAAALCRDDADCPGSACGNATSEAELRVTVTPAAPRIAPVEAITVKEGETVNVRVEVRSAVSGEGEFDGPVIIGVPRLPEGASFEITDEGAPEEVQYVDIEWTPTYYDAGTYTVAITGVAPIADIGRRREFTITVEEGGAPLLAAVGGTASRGLLTTFRYDRFNGQITFTRDQQIDVGVGAGGMAIGPEGRFVYVASPGSGGVAVVATTGGPARLVRRIPTGPGAYAVAWGAGRVWTISNGDQTLSVIDPETMKVEQSVSIAPLETITDLAWLPDGFDGIEGARLVAVSGRSGNVTFIDPDAVLEGNSGIISARRIGGGLQRIAVDPDSGTLAFADGKTRRVYRVGAAALLSGGDAEGLSTDFAPTDLIFKGGTLFAATAGGLWSFPADDDGTRDTGLLLNALGDLPEAIIGGGYLLGAGEGRVRNLDADLRNLIEANGARVRRLAAFVALE